MLGYAEEMLATQQRLLQSLGKADTYSGRLRIGVMDTVIHSWLSELINALSQDYPLVEVELTADTALNLSEQLLKGQLDLIFQTDLLRADGVRNVQLASYPLSWVVAKGAALDRPYDGLEDLCQERLLTFPGCHGRIRMCSIICISRASRHHVSVASTRWLPSSSWLPMASG